MRTARFWAGFWRGALCGFVCGLITFCAPAKGAPIGVLSTPNGQMVLHDETGHCARGARLVVWLDAEGPVPGCWTALREGMVRVALSDGDAYDLPVHVFQPVARPQRAPGTTL